MGIVFRQLQAHDDTPLSDETGGREREKGTESKEGLGSDQEQSRVLLHCEYDLSVKKIGRALAAAVCYGVRPHDGSPAPRSLTGLCAGVPSRSTAALVALLPRPLGPSPLRDARRPPPPQ